MSWKEQLQVGKFRDAAFLTDSSDGEIGRRLAMHTYPGRDLPYAEDLGRKHRQWTMNIYVLGADYMAARDKLITALEKKGPGSLVHHTLRTLNVVVLSARGPRESTREGGMARFIVTFAEAGANEYPNISTDTAAATREQIAITTPILFSSFTEQYTVDNLPEFVAAAAEELATDILLDPAITDHVDTTEALATITTTVRDPEALATQISTTVAAVSTTANDNLSPFVTLWNYGADLLDIAQTTWGRIIQALNQAALLSFLRRAALIEAVRASTNMVFDSYNTAAATRELLADQLDIEMAIADDQTYNALADLRSAMVRDITARGANLARVTTYQPSATLPALVISHQLYGTANRADEIVTRNNIRHPGFATGTDPLEVLHV